VIRFGYLIRGERMVKYTKKQIRELETALRWKIPTTHPRRLHRFSRSFLSIAGDLGGSALWNFKVPSRRWLGYIRSFRSTESFAFMLENIGHALC
jgi:hypothetical protein